MENKPNYNATVNRNSKLMYMSKAVVFQQCPKKYFWQHHGHIQTKERPSYFSFGSAFHKIVELGLRHNWDVSEALVSQRQDLLPLIAGKLSERDSEDFALMSEKDLKLLAEMMDAFRERWEETSKTIISTEESVLFPIGDASENFTHWVVKPDFMFTQHGENWVGDLKTTSGYGASTARYYHSSPQTKTYFTIIEAMFPELKLRGTKIYPVTKQKVRCEEETIILNDKDRYQASLFISETLKAIDQAEAAQHFPRCMSACVNSFGHECPYIPICTTPVKSEEYFQDLIANWYTISSPDAHLELGE